MDQVSDDVIGAPSLFAFITLRPRSRQVAQQCIEHCRRAFEQRYGLLQVGFHWWFLVLIQIFFWDIVLGNFVGAHFLLVGIVGCFYPRDRVGLEGVSFFHQLVDALRISALMIGESLKISRLGARTRARSGPRER